MKINNFLEFIINKKREFNKKYKTDPKYLYMGELEIEQLIIWKNSCLKFYKIDIETSLTFFGLKIIKVKEKTFLEFGF